MTPHYRTIFVWMLPLHRSGIGIRCRRENLCVPVERRRRFEHVLNRKVGKGHP
jgi:hypothetical protein